MNIQVESNPQLGEEVNEMKKIGDTAKRSKRAKRANRMEKRIALKERLKERSI